MVYRSAQLDSTFFALAAPTRREILSRLAAGDRSIGELASRFDMSLPAVSKHVRVLQRAGLASVEKRGRVRRATLNAAPMRHALEWIDHYRWFWESELDLRAKYLEAPATSPSERTWPEKPPHHHPSKSGARSARHANASSTRGRRKKK